MASTFQVAKTLCSLSGWRLTNLSLQKLLYLSHMFYLGTRGRPLIDGHFEAWDYGPVQPELYHKIKAYGNGPVADVFSCSVLEETSDECALLKESFEQLRDFTPAQLVAITHQESGAWAAHYKPNVHGIVIPNEEIRNEYVRREQQAAAPAV